MNEHERPGDPAFDRLVAADPARRAPDPAQSVLRAKVDALIAEQTGAEPGAPGSGREPAGREPAGSEQPDELAVRRHRRRTPWLVAAAVAGIVAVGGGGYLAGENGLGPEPTADRAVESSGDAPSLLGTPDEAGPDSEAESGVETLDRTGDLSAVTGFVFHAGAGLSDTPTTAQVRVSRAGSQGESLGAYPVISESEAVERLGDPRFAGAALGGSGQAHPSPGAGPRTVPEPGGPIAWPVQDVTIVTATLTEVRYTVSDGTELFVPAYDLADAHGNSWTVMAVDQELLDLAP
ncbi:hypothetical protein ACFS27_08760 [Promicromonospora vindobonensis]|uniref:Uncharacterized protein n=1 Tax=Promicromonospora vindobonensis TaxID=195748 RepID=A0ABW5VQV5_9MICO